MKQKRNKKREIVESTILSLHASTTAGYFFPPYIICNCSSFPAHPAFSTIQSYYSRFDVVLMSYDSRLILIRLDRRKKSGRETPYASIWRNTTLQECYRTSSIQYDHHHSYICACIHGARLLGLATTLRMLKQLCFLFLFASQICCTLLVCSRPDFFLWSSRIRVNLFSYESKPTEKRVQYDWRVEKNLAGLCWFFP